MSEMFTPAGVLLSSAVGVLAIVALTLWAEISTLVRRTERKFIWSDDATRRGKLRIHLQRLREKFDPVFTLRMLATRHLPIGSAVGAALYLLVAGIWTVFIA